MILGILALGVLAQFEGRPVEVIQVGRVSVIAAPSRIGLATELGEIADRVVKWPGLGEREPGPLQLVIVDGESEMKAASGGRLPDWGVGMALPSSRVIVLRADGGNPYQALRHELAHLALHEAIRVRVPLWFDEGYAVIASGELGLLGALRLNIALAGDRVPAFGKLERELRGGPATAQTAYALAGTAVGYLARRNPENSLEALIRILESGVGFEEAVVRTTGLSVSRLEEEWQRDTKRRYGWMVWIAAGGGWVVIAGIVVLATIWRRRLDRPRREALDIGWPQPEAEPELDRPGESS